MLLQLRAHDQHFHGAMLFDGSDAQLFAQVAQNPIFVPGTHTFNLDRTRPIFLGLAKATEPLGGTAESVSEEKILRLHDSQKLRAWRGTYSSPGHSSTPAHGNVITLAQTPPHRTPCLGSARKQNAQFSVGTFSAWSITSNSTGPFRASSLSPSCSWRAPKMLGSELSPVFTPSGVKYRTKL